MSDMDTMVMKTGWAGLEEAPPNLSTEAGIAQEKRIMAMSHKFEDTFTKGSGPDVLDALRRHAFGVPRFEISSDNMIPISLVRGGLQEMVEFIDNQILISQKGVYNV